MTGSERSTRCPTCGRRAMRLVRRTIKTRAGRREIAVPGVRVEECTACGERLYDLPALRKLAAARSRRRGSDAA